MRKIILVCGLLLGAAAGKAQTVSGRSSALVVEVSKDKIKRAHLAYLNVGVEDANRNKTLQKNEQAFIRFNIRNLSKFATRPLLVRAYPLEEVPGLQVQDTIRVKPIAAGKTQQVQIPLQGTNALPPGTHVVTVEIREELVFETDQLEINVLAGN